VDMNMDMAEYGDTLYGVEGDDDDCKYHVSWSSSTVCENAEVVFNLHIIAKAVGGPVSAAEPQAKVFLSDTHPGSVSDQRSSEISPGHYTVGPVRFDSTGKWTVRFHLFPTDCDLPTSPHGHVAFYVDVH